MATNENAPNTTLGNEETTNPQGYPQYPANEDIYNQAEKQGNRNTEGGNVKTDYESEFADEDMDDDLDVPGSELDDDEERIGSEDEENNSYSIGGDRHDDLDENRAEYQWL